MDAHQQKLRVYITHHLQTGQPADKIAEQLSAAGWPTDQVRQAFLAVQAHMVPTHMQTAAVPLQAQTPTVPTTAASTIGPQANGSRRGRIKTGWVLLKQSMRILKGNKYLLRYFLMTWVLVLVINVALCLILFFAIGSFFDMNGNNNTLWYGFAFLSYLIIYLVINFYAAAMASNILDIFRGIRKPYREYVKAARAKFWPIFVYSLIAAIIGMILQYVVERIKFIGRILAWLLGTAWSLGTIFVLPLIMETEVSAPSAIKQSIAFFKQTWGENIAAKVTVNAPLAILNILLWLVFGPFFAAAFSARNIGMMFFVLFTYIFLAINLALVGSFANSLINVALYYYAAHRQIPPGFDADMLNQVFIKHESHFWQKAGKKPTA